MFCFQWPVYTFTFIILSSLLTTAPLRNRNGSALKRVSTAKITSHPWPVYQRLTDVVYMKGNQMINTDLHVLK